jgi:hypothetical protein
MHGPFQPAKNQDPAEPGSNGALLPRYDLPWLIFFGKYPHVPLSGRSKANEN